MSPQIVEMLRLWNLSEANNVIPETPNDLDFASNTLREYKEEGQIKFSQYPQSVYIKVRDQDP